MSAGALPVDPGLLARFRDAGTRITWRPGAATRGRTAARIAHLHDEEARVEGQGTGRDYVLRTDSGPVGALVLLLEIDRRGPPGRLQARNAGAVAGFPQGALEATWGARTSADGPELPIADLVGLARYALA